MHTAGEQWGQALASCGWQSPFLPWPSAHVGSWGNRGSQGGTGHNEVQQTQAGMGSGRPRHSPRAGFLQGCSRTLQSGAGVMVGQAHEPPPPVPTWRGATHTGREGSGSSQGHSDHMWPPRSPLGTCTGLCQGHSGHRPLQGWNTGRAGSRGHRTLARRAHNGCLGSWVCTRSVPLLGPSGRRCPGSLTRCSHNLEGGDRQGSLRCPADPSTPLLANLPSPQTHFLTLLHDIN